MRVKILLPLLVIIAFKPAIGLSQGIYSDSHTKKGFIDTLKARGIIDDANRKRPEISLSRDQALDFLQRTCQPEFWKNIRDPFRAAIGHLIFEVSNPPFDSAGYYLKSFPYDSLSIPWDKFYIWEPMRFRINGTAIDTIRSEIPLDQAIIDTTFRTSPVRKIPSPGFRDTTLMVIVDTVNEVATSYKGSPFRYFRYPYQSDSIKAAVSVLTGLLEARDSSIVNISGITNRKTSVWLNSRSGSMIRYWLKNDLNDSVTVWIGNPERNTIGLYLEHGVIFRRPTIQGNVSGASVNIEKIDNYKLLDIKKIMTKTQYWKYRTETSFALNQGMLTNWVKGGESSISTSLDITAFFDYDNKPMLLSSNHFARLKYGLIASRDKGIMKNLDLLETNSKLNHKAFGKFDFSGIMLFKTQVARGYSYPNDSVPVSKFLNPAVLTIGFGLDYKPDKLTSINISPFSYKGTYVPDTASIDQTKYGVPSDRRSKHEPGASFMMSNEFRPVKNISVRNRLQLFTNYINNPLNIDVDWEMIVVANINWFTDVRLNTHLIFDDDTRTPVFDREDNPVLGTDGLQKKTARIQFKELLGFSFVFRF